MPEAYAVQAELERLLGWEVAGWFCACTNPVIQSMLGLSEPYYARLFAPFIYESEAELDADDFPPMVLECEFGFRLKQDLPPRAKPYTRVEVETAVASVHPTLEVVAGHLRNWPEQDVFSVIADNGTDGALVYGPGVEAWQSIDLARVEVALSVNGQRVRTGTGQNVMGDPMDALVWLANARARDGNGLKSGHLHNTGTATDIIWVERGDEAVVTFTELGAAALRVV
ncbi:MAG: fumarylacetoacetate hydrolase family protein [Pseudomonadota bacterium]